MSLVFSVIVDTSMVSKSGIPSRAWPFPGTTINLHNFHLFLWLIIILQMPNCGIIVLRKMLFLLLWFVILLLWETVVWKYGLALYSHHHLYQFCVMTFLILSLLLIIYYEMAGFPRSHMYSCMLDIVQMGGQNHSSNITFLFLCFHSRFWFCSKSPLYLLNCLILQFMIPGFSSPSPC